MCDEYKALIDNKTWVLVPRPPNVNIVRSMWLYKYKYNADGSLSRYKARLVANGRSQQQGIDCDDTFSPVVKPATIRTILSLAVSRQWPIHKLDVKNAFLHGYLTETVYVHQPPGFTDSAHSDYVCLLQKSLYSLKQAPRAWFQRFSSYAIRAGFYHSKTDSSLFIFHKGPDTAYLLLYVDDIILTASSTSLLQRIISSLHAKFAMTDLGPLNYFLGISATRTTSGIFLSQKKYATEILEQAQMLNCNPCRTPVNTEKKLGHERSPVTDPTLYRSLAGSLQYLTFTRSDLSYAVQQLCLYMHDLREPHLNAMKCYPAMRQYTSGYCVFLGDNLLTWSSKCQDMLSRSSVEAEYRGVANAVAETSWIRNLLCELHTPLSTATLV
ncbi:ribonuclease H-like domain-containing protein [Tanacetum coccineum]|uniref:Ribonuclease H-like domain-containing protein n=1 Tax=Tanacetum coccineum TaxID=301880 RepID=A0ABQ4YJ28_9ASTR